MRGAWQALRGLSARAQLIKTQLVKPKKSHAIFGNNDMPFFKIMACHFLK
jgi:hypothetical protein